ncbi:pilus assembly PilX N-terminal domain-containing protein [Oxalobacteraceae bacterium R-40]|uniref:Pilus assembly PilX N-terminal domain-containing protein n=1 Tax=Keguizhuia sedimenti TaxID=3064264 RepID=A0ABU1BS25_9BURK|nr:pilus assembly PilX N-terminal domain-containing protein [Oxalobacteraceae bacterium R-40]
MMDRFLMCKGKMGAHSVNNAGAARSPMHASLKSQHGVVLVIALIVLVGMTLAAIALVRSTETGNIVAGNLAFKRNATYAADAGIEAAVAYLVPQVSSADLQNDITAFGYYATSQDTLDRTGTSNDPSKARVDWDGNDCSGIVASACIKASDAITDDSGNTIRYIIHRLCQSTGDYNDVANSCVTYTAQGTASTKRGELKYGDNVRFASAPTPYYRITARAKGPRNTVTFVETIVHF